MTSTYRASGVLTNPVNDLAAAQAYLTSDDMTEYVKHADPESLLEQVVHHIEWRLTTPVSWKVEVITTRPLEAAEKVALSAWISGQNSDGLGEGFEQQAFAEPPYNRDRWGNVIEDYDEDPEYASFDWQTNECTLELVK